ncbi:MAG: DUF4919 domain-containing protein [Pyrinomonadaceae bacterium]
MKNKLLTLLLCILAATFVVQAQTAPSKPDDQIKPENSPKVSYQELLTKLKGGDTNIDYKALRMAFAETKDYSYDGQDKKEREKMMKPFGEKNYKEALKQADKILEKNYVDANAHQIAYLASKELKDDKNAEFHKAVLVGLLSSIQDGNDGTSAKTAFQPITIDEEYTLMKFLGYKSNSQSLKSIDGHRYDVFTAVNARTNENTTLYFNIDKIWEAENKQSGK